MSQWKNIVSAARLRTLPLAFSCIITGTAMVCYFEAFHWDIFIFSLLTTLLLQILSNFSNDIGDAEKGVDNEERIGPKRAIQSGTISIDSMNNYIKFLSFLVLIVGCILIIISEILWWEKCLILFLGLLAIWSARNYTQGDRAYGYKGWGDFFVFIFFGIVGVLGTFFLNIHKIHNAAFLPAIGVGCFSVAVLHLNNMRDFINDQKHGKKTLAIQLGLENSKLYFLTLVSCGIICWASYVLTQNQTNYSSYLYWIGFLFPIMILFKFFRVKELKDYDKLLKPMALSTFLVSILFLVSQIL